MDRQHHAETTNRLDDKILQKALGVITQSYQGVPPEKLFNEAIHCFDALIDISLQTENIRDFAKRKHLDSKYIVDGANFVISKMHFNTENNHYITLGLSSTASSEMIRERWKRLMLLYHPDRQHGAEEWVSERAKKVNEAYNTLKDEEKRTAYNRMLSESASDMNVISPQKVRTRKSRGDTHILPLSPGWIKLRTYLPKMLVGIYIIIALFFIWFIYIQNRSSHLETALLQEEPRIAEHIEPTLSSSGEQEAHSDNNEKRLTVIPKPGSADQSASLAVRPEADRSEDNEGILRQGPRVSPGRTPQDQSKDILQQGRAVIRPLSLAPGNRVTSNREKDEDMETGKHADTDKKKVSSTEIVYEEKDTGRKSGEQQHEIPTVQDTERIRPDLSGSGEKEIITESTQKKESSVKSSGEHAKAKKDILKAIKSPLAGDPDSQSTSPQLEDMIEQPHHTARVSAENKVEDVRKAVAGLPSRQFARPRIAHTITSQEVESFMKRYIQAYKKSDIELFMSFFSVSAVENNTLNYKEIRKRYETAFKNKIQGYDISDMDIKIDPPAAHVSGFFVITQFNTSENLWHRFNGKISWKIIRENDNLKIARINYDY